MWYYYHSRHIVLLALFQKNNKNDTLVRHSLQEQCDSTATKRIMKHNTEGGLRVFFSNVKTKALYVYDYIY